MVACPYPNSPEWIKLVDAVGETEAYKVFLANGELVPDMNTIDLVIAKFKGSKTSIDKYNELTNYSDILNINFKNLDGKSFYSPYNSIYIDNSNIYEYINNRQDYIERISAGGTHYFFEWLADVEERGELFSYGVKFTKQNNSILVQYDPDTKLRGIIKGEHKILSEEKHFDNIYDGIKALYNRVGNINIFIPELKYNGTTSDFLGIESKIKDIKKEETKDEFIARKNLQIENGMYKEKSGKLVPITDDYNPETWWYEKKEGLVTFPSGNRTPTLFNYSDAHEKTIELNRKYPDENVVFGKEQIVFPSVYTAKSRNLSPNKKPIYRIKVTSIPMQYSIINEISIDRDVEREDELIVQAFELLEDKTPVEAIDVLLNLDIADELKTLLTFFRTKLKDNPTLKFAIKDYLSNKKHVSGSYIPSTNTITLYRKAMEEYYGGDLTQVIGISFAHELLHSFTEQVFQNYKEGIANDKEKEFIITITRLYNIAKKQTKYKNEPAFENAEEWISVILTDPMYLNEAMKMRLNVWQRILAAFKRLFGISSDSVYNQAFDNVISYIYNTSNFRVTSKDASIKLRKLEEDVHLRKENETHVTMWNKLQAFANQFDFNEGDHTYFHKASKEFFYSTTEQMKRIGITPKYKLSEDPEKAELQTFRQIRGLSVGNITHGITEANLKQVAINILESNNYKWTQDTIDNIESILKQFKRPGVTVLSEVLVADISLKLAGSIDIVVIDENNKVHLYDIKTKVVGFSRLKLKNPITRRTPLEEYAFQLSVYKDAFEKMTGLDVESLNVITIKPEVENKTVVDIKLDTTHSKSGIITVPYNRGVYALYSLLKSSGTDKRLDTLNEFNRDKLSDEERAERDEELRKVIETAKNNLEDLTEEERGLLKRKEIIYKSAEALVFKRQVLYRTGKRSQIESHDELIEHLLDEDTEVEEALINLVKYANTSAIKIWNEYEEYKKEGKTIPLTILYAWKDSVSVWNSLLNDEEGLLNLINKEFGLKNGPEYRKILEKTILLVAQVKDLYREEGTEQLIDFLAPHYNRLYAELKRKKIKEYRKKKITGQIPSGLSEAQYISEAFDEEGETLERETRNLMRKEIIKASRDINVLTRWIDNVLDSEDPVTAAMVKAFVFADDESRLGSLAKRDEVASVIREMENWYKNNGGIPKSVEEFYNFMLERNEDTGELTGYYITKAKSSMMDQYRHVISVSKDLETSEQRKVFIKAWLNENNPLQKEAFREAYSKYYAILNSDGILTNKEYDLLEENALYNINKLSIGEMLEKGLLSYRAHEALDKWLTTYTWDFRIPIKKWINSQYTKLLPILKDSNDPRKKLYDLIVKLRQEGDSFLPFGFRLDSRLPGIIKQGHERIQSGQSIGATIRAGLSRELKFKIDDTHRIHEELTDEAENAKYFLPIHFTGRVQKKVKYTDEAGEEYEVSKFDVKEQSFDLASIYYRYWSMAYDYNVKAKILPEMELAKFMIKKRPAIKYDSYGRKILRKTLKRNKGINDDEGKPRVENNTYLAEQVEDWFKAVVYGIQEKDAGKLGKLDLGKILNFVNSYVSLNLLGLNVVAGTANVILGNVLERIESFAGEYMSPKDFLYADKYYFGHMKGMIGDIGSRDAKGLGTHLIEYFGVLDDYGIADADRRTKFGQLWRTDTLYSTSRVGEHYMQGRFLFGLLANKRAIDNEGNDIGRMLDYYEMKDGKLILNEKVNVVKSKWEQKDIDNFKYKTRGILSRLHGEYSALGKVAIQRMALGRMAYLFRHFIVPGFRRRWGREKYIERLGQFVEGNYITTGKFIGDVGGRIFGKTDENSELDFFSRLINNLQSFKFSLWKQDWAAMTDHEKANIQRTLYEVGFLVLAVILSNIAMHFKGEADDDDDEFAQKYWSFVAYQTYRLQNELLFFTPKLDSAFSILRSPAASISFLENLIELSGQIFHPLDIYEAGPWKGRSKIIKTTNNMLPLLRQYYRLRDLEVQIPWMQKASLSGRPRDKTE